MNKCPRCGSTHPNYNSAVQHEGEVQICKHKFHTQPAPVDMVARVHEVQQALETIGRSPHQVFPSNYSIVAIVTHCHFDAGDLIYLIGEGLKIFGPNGDENRFCLTFEVEKPVDPQVTEQLQQKLGHVDLELFRLVQAGEKARVLLKRIRNDRPAKALTEKLMDQRDKLRSAMWDLMDYIPCPPEGESGYADWKACENILKETGNPYHAPA